MGQVFYISSHKTASDVTNQLLDRHGRFKMAVSEWKDTRNNAQNRKMWALLTDISQQVEWHGVKYSKEDWKHIFTASLKGQRAAPMVDGSGMVFLGQSTSKMTIAAMTELIEYMLWFGAEKNVIWSDESCKQS